MKKTVLITGASHGIGRETAILFAKQNYNVVINYNSSENEAQSLAASELKEQGFDAIAVKADVSKRNEVEEMFQTVNETFGDVHILVNNAGIIKRNDAIDYTEEDWDSVVFLNQKFTFFLCQAAAKQFIAQKSGGKIINIASMLSYQGGIRVPSYTASKSAVLGLTRAMANEWAKYNINVNGIAPGYMATNNTQALRNDDDRSDEILSRIPAGRWGTPADMAGAVVYLASAASDYVNGFTLAVDGGWLAR